MQHIFYSEKVNKATYVEKKDSVLPVNLVEIALGEAISVISAELDGGERPGLALASVWAATNTGDIHTRALG